MTKSAIEAKPIDTSEHGIAIEFPDDHSINGIRIRVLGLTPEQIMIAVFNLERVANAAADHRVQQAQRTGLDTGGGRGQAPIDIDKIMRDPRGGVRT